MHTADFVYELPYERIAQKPAEPRDASRLLVLERATGKITHTRFAEIGAWLRTGDLLTANDSRVIPARLHGRKESGGAIEVLLLHEEEAGGARWRALVRGKVRAGTRILFGDDGALQATVEAANDDGTRLLRFSAGVRPWLDELGEMPLPPYINAWHGDPERYQTIFSRPEGSAAAPTAGLHFTPELLATLRAGGVEFETVTLHVGLDTFRPIEAEEVEDHAIHTEWAQLAPATANRINRTVLEGGRIVAVGTTSARTLEWAATGAQGMNPWGDPQACGWKRTAAFEGPVPLYIYPGYRFRAVDALVTNFHLPRSSLLLLVSAFIAQITPDDPDAGRRMLLAAYAQAIELEYRFYSFGDAMLIL